MNPKYPEEKRVVGMGIRLRAKYTRSQWVNGCCSDRYWSVRQAANAWGCTYGAASVWLRRHPGCAIDVAVLHPSGRWLHRYMMHAGISRAEASSCEPGNPLFKQPEYQRQLVTRRWSRARSSGEQRIDRTPEGVLPGQLAMTDVTPPWDS